MKVLNCLLKVCIFRLSQTNQITIVSVFLLWHVPGFDINLDHDMPNCDMGHTAGATGQQGMFTPHRHLIPSLSFYRSVFLCLEFLFCLMDFLDGWWLVEITKKNTKKKDKTKTKQNKKHLIALYLYNYDIFFYIYRHKQHNQV